MILRQFRRVLTMVAIATLSAGHFASADTTSDAKFQKDLESLLGAPIKTKRGPMNLRQTKDRRGHVRKQILVGTGFSEIQLDQNGDGTVDYWSVNDGKKSVVASEPSRGRFLRLVVSETFPKGMVESTYLLSLNGRKYNLLKSRFIGNDVRYASESDGAGAPGAPPVFDVNTEAEDESDRVQKILDTGGSASPSVDAKPIPRTTDDRFTLVEADWTTQQTTVFGDELVCMATDNGYGRLASLQREWWKVLKFEVDEKADRLAEKLKSSSMFADSCKTPENAVAYDRMTKQLSQVMLSSAKGEAWTSDKSRGRYLRCLENSGLGITAAEMERGFLDGLTSPYRSYAPISCDFKPGKSGQTKPGEAFPARRQVVVYMSAADEGKRDADGATQNYANVLFHEMIHLAGISSADENLVHAATACCGDPSAARGVGCNQLDLLMAKKKRATELETVLSRVAADLTPLQAQLESTFGADDANKIYKSFVQGLDNYKKGSPPQGAYADGLISSSEIAKCVAISGAAACKTKWTSEIRAYAETFFQKECRVVAAGANRKNCKTMSSEFKESMANTIASSLIEVPTVPPSPGQCVGRTNAAKELLTVPNFVARFLTSMMGVVAGAADGDEEDLCGGPRSEIPSAPKVSPVVCVGSECAPSSNPTVDAADGPGEKSFSTPGQAQTGTVAGTDDRPSVPANPGSGGGGITVGGNGNSNGNGDGKTSSPLPVRRVDSVTDGQSFADDHYRRATDIVGSATRGLEKVRDSILPHAEAGDGDRSRASTRLDLRDNFIPFRPGESRAISNAIDNPFSEKRSIASVADIKGAAAAKSAGVPGSSSGSSSGSSAAGALVEGGSIASSSGKSAGANGSKDRGGARGNAAAGGVLGAGGSTSSRATASVNEGGGKAGQDPKRDVLEGLFKLPYREIESRLNRIEVVEALIGAKISVQDAKGRVLGSRKAKEQYLFAGFDKPLQRTKD